MKAKKRTLYIVIIAFILTLCIGIFKFTDVAAAEENSDREKTYIEYTVQAGDTLWSISELYMSDEYEDITVYIDEVCTMNHTHQDNTLITGQSIILPVYRTI